MARVPAQLSMAGGDGSAALSTLGAALATLPLGPPPEFRAELRSRLVAAATTPAAFAPARGRGARSRAVRWNSRRILAAVSAGLTVVAAGGGVAVAAESALPGGALFGLKIDLEQLHFDLTGGDGARGRLELSFAADRLRELGALGAGASHAAVLTDLGLLSSETRRGARLLLSAARSSHSTAPLAALTRFALSSGKDLHALLAVLPASVQPQGGSAEALMSAVGAQARAAAEGLRPGAGALLAPLAGTASVPTGSLRPLGAPGGLLVPLLDGRTSGRLASSPYERGTRNAPASAAPGVARSSSAPSRPSTAPSSSGPAPQRSAGLVLPTLAVEVSPARSGSQDRLPGADVAVNAALPPAD
jgi:hypothetical protein